MASANAGVVRYAKPPMLGTDGIGADIWNEARIALTSSRRRRAAAAFRAAAAR